MHTTAAVSTSLDFNTGSGYCPYCSNPPHQYIYHGGTCPLVKAKEYHQNGTLKRIEFHDPPGATVNIDAPVSPAYWRARIAVIEERMVLEPGRYIIIDGELFKLEDSVPPGLE